MSKPIPTALILKCEELIEKTTSYTYGHIGVTESPTIEGCIEKAKQFIEKNKNGPYPADPNTKIMCREVIETTYGNFEEIESVIKENQAINKECV